jgi:acid phosphatase (class A)
MTGTGKHSYLQTALLAPLLVTLFVPAQTSVPGKTPNYFQPELLHLSLILPPPPAAGSSRDEQELAEILHIQRTRTPEDVSRARKDDQEEDIFIFRDVIGKDFTAANLPFLAAFSARLKNDSEMVDPPLKHLYRRPRPYTAHHTIHPVCQFSSEPSYPSGHAMLGYLFAFVMAQIIPEKHDAIVKRAQEYAEHRLVCGVHYRSDIEASRFASATLFGQMLGCEHFEQDLAEARREIRNFPSNWSDGLENPNPRIHNTPKVCGKVFMVEAVRPGSVSRAGCQESGRCERFYPSRRVTNAN